MKHILFQVKKPEGLTRSELDEIIHLHQTAFNIPTELIIEFLMQRETLLLYRDKKSQALIATVGLSILLIKNNVISYVGNVVIDNKFKHKGIFVHSQFYNAIRLILKYPLKNKFLCGLATTKEAYEWGAHFPIFWPHEKQATPAAYLNIMTLIAKKMGKIFVLKKRLSLLIN